jgi:Protein of unknown function (DUF3306)
LEAVAMADSAGDGTRSDGFLSRWSRRKQDVRAGVPVADVPPLDTASARATPEALKTRNIQPNQPSAQQNIAQAATNNVASDAPDADASALPPAPTLDDAKALTLESDFKPFMASNVSSEVKNAAMKKLFTDPHYNVMDMLDTYVDDYSKPDPIPESMLKEMVAVKFLKLFERDEEDAEKAKDEVNLAPVAAPVADATQEPAAQPRDDADTPDMQSVAQLPPSIPIDNPKPHDDPDLRLQPNHAAERKSVGRSAG